MKQGRSTHVYYNRHPKAPVALSIRYAVPPSQPIPGQHCSFHFTFTYSSLLTSNLHDKTRELGKRYTMALFDGILFYFAFGGVRVEERGLLGQQIRVCGVLFKPRELY